METKEMIIDAIIGGVRIPQGGINEKLTPFTGNQWNPKWDWNREALEKISESELALMYMKSKQKGE